MMNWLQKVFGAPGSSATAKERLRLVLLTDHLSLAPDVVDALKRDLLEVISRYVDVDETHSDITFERQESAVAMLANIPITGMRERPRPTPPGGGEAVATAAPVAEATPVAVTVAEPNVVQPAEPAHAESEVQSEEPRTATPRRRRRRRRAPAAAPGSIEAAG